MFDRPREEHTLPFWYVAELIGVTGPHELAFGRDVVRALERIAPELAPRLRPHPLEELMARGVGGLRALMDRFDSSSSDDSRALVLEAIMEVIGRDDPAGLTERYPRWLTAEGGPPCSRARLELVAFLEGALGEATTPDIASLAARALAMAGSEPFLEHQRRLLGATSPSTVALAARLLGHGRYEPAVPMLLDALRPNNAMAADAIIWALGEIGAPAAVAKLHTILAQFGMTEAVIEALGKIGSRVSVGRLFPFLLEGEAKQRERASEALARIVKRNDGSLGDPALDASVRGTLETVIQADESLVVRFHAILAHARLGGHLAPARILAALGGRLSDRALAALDGVVPDRPRSGGPGPKATRD